MTREEKRREGDPVKEEMDGRKSNRGKRRSRREKKNMRAGSNSQAGKAVVDSNLDLAGLGYFYFPESHREEGRGGAFHQSAHLSARQILMPQHHGQVSTQELCNASLQSDARLTAALSVCRSTLENTNGSLMKCLQKVIGWRRWRGGEPRLLREGGKGERKGRRDGVKENP
ncbi:unnamed protein product [Pleuronectes platessa]|uniref:Uncharacterized protein n=1 Tax=Pleuronectes platessa TaxID=8262 RepID=A0A9N7ZDG3_PLEPL|nr:unnamed protein product [Pleuronectes platessa]